MALTMKWPPEITAAGGVRTLTDPVVITAQMVGMLCIPGRSANAWDKLEGAGYEGGAYDVAGDAEGVVLANTMRNRFRALERAGLARLLSNPKVSVDDSGERTVDIEYFDLRAQIQRSARFVLNGGST
jgi:hypothetical protein